jgi:hypothetical protein
MCLEADGWREQPLPPTTERGAAKRSERSNWRAGSFQQYPLISEVSSWRSALNARRASNKIGARSAAMAYHMYAANRQVDSGFRYYFLNPAVQFVATVRGGDSRDSGVDRGHGTPRSCSSAAGKKAVESKVGRGPADAALTIGSFMQYHRQFSLTRGFTCCDYFAAAISTTAL